jgi:Matrixin
VRNLDHIVVPLLLVCLLLFCSSASAWVQTSEINDDDEQVFLAWQDSCFHYSVNVEGVENVELSKLRAIVRSSFDSWENVECSYFSFEETEPAQTKDVDFYLNKGNVNVLAWRDADDGWPYSDSIVALTSAHFDARNGRILDADIEFNSVDFTFGAEEDYPENTELFDLQNTVTHEIGHTVGLDHSSDTKSTMYLASDPGAIQKRTLNQDDINGLCDIYPSESDPEICYVPYCGLDLTGESVAPCVHPIEAKEEGCSVVSTGRTDLSISLLIELARLF